MAAPEIVEIHARLKSHQEGRETEGVDRLGVQVCLRLQPGVEIDLLVDAGVMGVKLVPDGEILVDLIGGIDARAVVADEQFIEGRARMNR